MALVLLVGLLVVFVVFVWLLRCLFVRLFVLFGELDPSAVSLAENEGI